MRSRTAGLGLVLALVAACELLVDPNKIAPLDGGLDGGLSDAGAAVDSAVDAAFDGDAGVDGGDAGSPPTCSGGCVWAADALGTVTAVSVLSARVVGAVDAGVPPLHLLATGNSIVVSSGPNAISIIDLSTFAIRQISSTGIEDPRGMALARDGTLVIACHDGGIVLRDSNGQSRSFAGYPNASAVAFAPGGAAFWLGYESPSGNAKFAVLDYPSLDAGIVVNAGGSVRDLFVDPSGNAYTTNFFESKMLERMNLTQPTPLCWLDGGSRPVTPLSGATSSGIYPPGNTEGYVLQHGDCAADAGCGAVWSFPLDACSGTGIRGRVLCQLNLPRIMTFTADGATAVLAMADPGGSGDLLWLVDRQALEASGNLLNPLDAGGRVVSLGRRIDALAVTP